MRWPRIDSDVPWSSDYLALSAPERVESFDDLTGEAAPPTALSSFAVTSPFRVLSETGTAIAHAICADLAAYATGDERISRRTRSGVYQSEFLRGLAADPWLIEFLSELAGTALAAHPISHQAIHINYAPRDLARHVVDDWHVDSSVSYDYVMMLSDPVAMRGGQFEYLRGSRASAAAYLDGMAEPPPDRVVAPTFPRAGWAVFMQGHEVVHRAHRLEAPYPRITLIGSFIAPRAARPDPQDRVGPLTRSDPADVALVEWSRYVALAAGQRLEALAASTGDLTVPLDDPGGPNSSGRSPALRTPLRGCARSSSRP